MSRHQTESKRTESAQSQEPSKKFIQIELSLSLGINYFPLNRQSPEFGTKVDWVLFERANFVPFHRLQM